MKLTPQKIARQLKRVQMRGGVRLVSKVLLPNHFAVQVPQEFASQWSVFLPRLQRELAEHLENCVAQENYIQLCGPIEVNISPGPKLRPSQMRIQAGFVRETPGQASLRALQGLPSRSQYPLIKPVTIIGRGEVDLALPAERAFISRRHARLTQAADDFHLEDLDSRSGTFVNDQPVTRCPLNSGDQITIGDIVLEFSAQRAGEAGA